MTTFIIRRIIWTIPVIFLVILMTFVLMRQIEGNPFRRTERAVPEAIQRNLEEKFNLDKPTYMQFLLYVKGVFTLDLGPSLVLRNRSVMDIIENAFPKSLKLGMLAFAWAILLGVPAGILAALRPNSIFDYFAMTFSNLGFALPNFFVATLLIYYLALQVDLLPTSGWPRTFWEFDKRVVLPSFALGLAPMAYFARLVRGSMLETMQQDYVRTARAKGLRYRRVVGLHVLRNSLIPAVTVAAPLLGLVITGTFVIEFIFSIPGMGRFFIDSVRNRDYSVVMGITVLTSVIVVVANLVVDILYGILDPRTRDVRT
jgi:ABC-type dipeptide/oligopeptide/nickel transport system permease component